MNRPKPSVQTDPHSEPSDSTPLAFTEGLLLEDLSGGEENVFTSSDVGARGSTQSLHPRPHSEVLLSEDLSEEAAADVSTSSDFGAVSGSSKFHAKSALSRSSFLRTRLRFRV